MLSKYWKKIGMVIVIVACVFNVMIKLINKLSMDNEMVSSAQYVQDNTNEQQKDENKNQETQNTQSKKIQKNEK
ncbi:MAG: hypothetical protein J5881_00770 [Clostridia bacterium]|nr:hypothetical protein [Clostridia bacterium]